MNISSKIKELRELRGLNRAQLAKEIGVKREQVSAWEAGKYKPSEENLDKLAAYFGVNPASLLYTGIDEKSTPVLLGAHGDTDKEKELLEKVVALLEDRLAKCEEENKILRMRVAPAKSGGADKKSNVA